MMKRIFDIIVSGSILCLFFPLLLIIACLIRLKMGSPVLFTQTRPGLNGKLFNLIKFRTMLDETGPNGKPLPDEMRLTRFGQLLRSTSLDELPELWNVLKGDMSLVGPRPLLPEYLSLYNNEQLRRHDVPPGVTGWAQVNGRNANSWEDKFKLDIWYVDNRSFWLDLKILCLTVNTVLIREGIAANGFATTYPFRGDNDESKNI